MRQNLMSAAAVLCMVSGLAMAQDAACCEEAEKAVECEVAIECEGEGEECVVVSEIFLDGEAEGGTFQVVVTADENGEMEVNFERIGEGLVEIREIGAGLVQPEVHVETHMTMIKQDGGHEYKVEIKGDDVKAWVDGDRVSKKRLKITDKEIRILDGHGETVAEFGRHAQIHMEIGEGDAEHRVMLRELRGDHDGPIVWEGEDGKQMKIIKRLGGEGDVQFFGGGGEGLHLMQPEVNTPPVMIGISMGQLEDEDAIEEIDNLFDREIDSDNAILVTRVIDHLPADEAGLREGDVIVRADGKWGVNAEKLLDILMDKEPGDGLEFLIVRDGKRHEIEVELAPFSGEKLGRVMKFEIEMGDEPRMFRGEMDGDIREMLEHLRENRGRLGEGIGEEVERMILDLRQGELGRLHELDALPRILIQRMGEGDGEDRRFFVQPAPAPRAESMRGYEDRLARIEDRLERLEHQIGRLINALQDRERDDD